MHNCTDDLKCIDHDDEGNAIMECQKCKRKFKLIELKEVI